MASVKILIRLDKKKKDGTCPIAIRAIIDRKPTYFHTGYYVTEKDWNTEQSKVRKSYPNSGRLNNLLIKKLASIQQELMEADSNNTLLSTKGLRESIIGSTDKSSLFELAKIRIQSYEKKETYSVANAEQSILNNIERFLGHKDLKFEEINHSFIEKFTEYCHVQLKHKKRTITNQHIFLRTMFNIAIKQGVVKEKYYPFAGDGTKIKISSGLKIGLSKDEVQLIENLHLEEHSQIWHTKNVWLIAYYFAGMRISDILTLEWSDLLDGRLMYVMGKNDKSVSLKIPQKAIKILDHYEERKSQKFKYIFHYLDDADQKDPRDVFRKIRNATSLLNEYLERIASKAGIEKNISNHIARHTFGNIAGDKIHPLMLQKLYRHGDLKTTINYQANFIHKEADEALDQVID